MQLRASLLIGCLATGCYATQRITVPVAGEACIEKCRVGTEEPFGCAAACPGAERAEASCGDNDRCIEVSRVNPTSTFFALFGAVALLAIVGFAILIGAQPMT